MTQVHDKMGTAGQKHLGHKSMTWYQGRIQDLGAGGGGGKVI